MDGKPDKPHRIRVRTCDGKPRDARELNRLRSNQLGMPHLDIFQTDTPTELIICASIEDHIKAVRNKLAGAGLEEIANGNTTITTEDRMKTVSQPSQQGPDATRWPDSGRQRTPPATRTTACPGEPDGASPRQALRVCRTSVELRHQTSSLARRHGQQRAIFRGDTLRA